MKINAVSQNLSATQENPLPHSFDYSLQYVSSFGTLALVSGWVSLENTQALVVVDGMGENPSLMQAVYWPRKDVNLILGKCRSPYQRGYGFLGIAKDYPSNMPLQIFGAGAGVLRSVGSIKLKEHQCAEAFTEDILAMPLPWIYSESIYSFLQDCAVPLKREYNKAGRNTSPQYGEFGRSTPCPLYSLLIPLGKNNNNIDVQLLSLSEDENFRNDCEIIFLLADTDFDEQTLSDMAFASDLYRLPVRWVLTNGLPTYTNIFNEGFKAARGETIIFSSSSIIPKEKGWLGKIARLLTQNSNVGAISCGMADIYDNLFNGVNEIIFPSDFSGYNIINTPPVSENILTSATALNHNIFAIKTSDFEKAGAFDDGYITGALAVLDLCENLQKMGKTIAHISSALVTHINPCLPDSENIAEKRKRMWDAALYKKKWYSYESSNRRMP